MLMKLDDYLNANGVTEAVFAEKIGLSQPQVNRIRSGKSWPSRHVMERIAVETGGKVTANDFLNEDVS